MERTRRARSLRRSAALHRQQPALAAARFARRVLLRGARAAPQDVLANSGLSEAAEAAEEDADGGGGGRGGAEVQRGRRQLVGQKRELRELQRQRERERGRRTLRMDTEGGAAGSGDDGDSDGGGGAAPRRGGDDHIRDLDISVSVDLRAAAAAAFGGNLRSGEVALLKARKTALLNLDTPLTIRKHSK